MITLDGFRRLSGVCSWLPLAGISFPPRACAIMSGACAAPPSPEILEAWRSITSAPYPSELVSQLVLEIGRGGMKSSMAIVLGFDRVLRFDAAPYVAPGSEVYSLHVAPKKEQASALLRNNLPIAGRWRSSSAARSRNALFATGRSSCSRFPAPDTCRS